MPSGSRVPAVEVVVEQLRRRVPGGIGTYCDGLVAGLACLPENERPDVGLFASRPPSPGRDPLSRLGLPLRTSSLPGPVLTRLWDKGVPAGYRSARPGVVHATSLAAPSLGKGGLVVTVHDLAWRRLPDAFPPRGREWHDRSLARLAARAARFVVPSSLTASDLCDAGLGVGPGQVEVIEEGADHLEPPDHDSTRLLLDRLGVPEDGGYLLSASTLEPRKNLRRLMRAYQLARRELEQDWPLIVVGPAGWGEAISGGHDDSSHVLAAGHVGGAVLSALYAGARCVAYVPLFEGFGLPAVEAMSSGAPVVVTAGLPSAAGAGFAVDPYDPESIAAGLLAASNEGPERRRLLADGPRRAASLRWEDAAAAHVRVWAEVAAAPGGA